jgi:hypothetical protein
VKEHCAHTSSRNDDDYLSLSLSRGRVWEISDRNDDDLPLAFNVNLSIESKNYAISSHE